MALLQATKFLAYMIKNTQAALICFRLPVPALPAFGLIPYILVDSFVICMVAYSTTISMALIIAQKSNYEIDSNQELLAMVFVRLVLIFFCEGSCFFLSLF